MILLENANVRFLKCDSMFYPVISVTFSFFSFRQKCRKAFSQDVAMSIIPHIIGEPFLTYWETSPLVGNYFPSAGTTNLY